MSFILDALRKSENERQQSAVPGISDVPAVVQRNRVPRWTMGVIAGLAACLIVLAWAWLRDSGPGADPVGAGLLTPPTPAVGTGQVRSLAREARQSATAPAATPRGAVDSNPAPSQPEAPAMSDGPILTLAEFQASGGILPELNLELHVFSDSAAERFVFINSARYREGESLPEGPRLLSIREDGVVLGYQSRSLLLPRE